MLVTSGQSPIIAAGLAAFIAERTGEHFAAGSFAALGWVEQLKVTGAVIYHNQRGRDIVASIALDNGRFPRRLLEASLQYAFGQLARSRLTFFIDPANLRSINLVTALGAIHEATLRDAGESGDMYLFALFPANCRIWKRMSHRGKKRTESP
jgi:hypothetical protein